MLRLASRGLRPLPAAGRLPNVNGLRCLRWITSGAAVVGGLAGCTSPALNQASTRPRAAPTPSVPANVQAANGALVENPSLVSGEQSCATAENNAPWYP